MHTVYLIDLAVDTSAIVAILFKEADAQTILYKLASGGSIVEM